MAATRICAVASCTRAAETSCANCGRPLCREHTVADFSHLPGGQRPYCPECDARRRELYRAARSHGWKAILWSGGGALIGSAFGLVVGILVTRDSFAHTVTTDVGFLIGLAVALFLALRRGRGSI